MRSKFGFWLLIALVVLLAGCGRTATDEPTQPSTTPPGPVELTVFAAASLSEAFRELGKQFEMQHPGVTVLFNFAGSNQLAAQINEGAPADVFASANQAQMQVALEGGRIDAGAPRVFARNRLVAIYPEDNPGGLGTLLELAKPGVQIVFAAREVPVGQYSLDFLEKAAQDPEYGAAFKAGVLANVVSYEENVRAVLTKVALGEADAGIVYTSDLSGASADQVGRIEIPDAVNTIATYPIATLNDSPQSELAQAFIELVISPEGQSVLESYGFITVLDD